MNQQSDSQLLRAYAESRSEAAFAELVGRHLDFVYSVALRMVRDPHLAEDVTQGVFVALTKNAVQLTDRSVVSGWLHRTAQNIAAQTVRTIERRRAREQEAADMNELLSAEPNIVWENIALHLDAALGELSEPDRDALLLRYFERKSAREMAQTLGISDEAAQKRVSRAVERLREFFAKRGVTVGASGLAILISANAIQSAPAALAAQIAASVLTTATIAATAAAATKTIAMTTLQKTLITAALAVAAGTGIFEAHQASQLRDQNRVLQQQQSPLAEQIQHLQLERDEFARQLAALRDDRTRSNFTNDELLKLRAEVSQLRNERQRFAKLVSTTNGSPDAIMSEGIKWNPKWKDAGQSTPEAGLETYFWALTTDQSERVRQSILLDHGDDGSANAEASLIFAKREARGDGPTWRAAALGGVRIHKGFAGPGQNLDHANFDIEYMGPRPEAVSPDDNTNLKELVPIDPANPPAWNPDGNQTFNLVKVGDEWKITRPNRLRLTIDDEDSEAVAKMMMQMDSKTLEQLKANPGLPPRTLRAYEELKARSAQ